MDAYEGYVGFFCSTLHIATDKALCKRELLWSSFFVTLMAKKYYESVTLHSAPQTEFDNH